ncbi:endonuclease/exonuclease/phosphatase family protein [Chitinolyticbacter albus]|uniref:endonuclease/exonuclease/phosphatase family protein n=1 Tax=Chitinolyticbacter albus TaxID=2961951 RepID=UPI00210E9DF0|nr:endonuclease/exonuclease/phosphatase family protein [Chitinolyticbacter albus]
MLGRWHWLLELFSHFALFYLPCLLLAALLVGRGWWRLLLLTLALWQAWFIAAPLRVPQGHAVTRPAPLRIVAFNVYYRNGALAPAAHWLRRENADLLFLTEVTEDIAGSLAGVLVTYPQSCRQLANSPFGLLLASRRPLRACEVVEVEGEYRAYPYVRAVLDDGRVIYGIHPPPPLDGALARARDAMFSALAQAVRAERAPVIVLGDMNSTPFSPRYADFLVAADLREAGSGVWPTWGPAGWWLLPLDRVLLRGAIRSRAVTLGPALGSDHRPLRITLE